MRQSHSHCIQISQSHSQHPRDRSQELRTYLGLIYSSVLRNRNSRNQLTYNIAKFRNNTSVKQSCRQTTKDLGTELSGYLAVQEVSYQNLCRIRNLPKATRFDKLIFSDGKYFHQEFFHLSFLIQLTCAHFSYSLCNDLSTRRPLPMTF